jgi:hypothetical protein
MSITSGEESEINQQTRMTEKCSACGQRIPVAEPTCPNCGWRRKTPLTESQTIQALKPSALAGWFTAFAVISFIVAAVAIYQLSTDNRIDNQQGAVLLPAGISSGLFCLAVAKIIRCLHESSHRLLKIDREIINGQREIAKALQWMVDNWKIGDASSSHPPPAPPL